MYLSYCIALLIFVYIAPALAIYPRMLFSSRKAVAIPFLSVFIIYLLTSIFSKFGLFSQGVLIIISLTFFITALCRLTLLHQSEIFDWPQLHVFVFIINLLIALSFSVNLGIESFSTDDEIYSWNMWAVQYFLGESVDFYYTKSPYPQLFRGRA